MPKTTKLIIDYMDAKWIGFADPQTLFQQFIKHLDTDTINEDGFDPPGLYWILYFTVATNSLVNALTGLIVWLVQSLINTIMHTVNPAEFYGIEDDI